VKKSPSISKYELTARYGNLLLHQETVVVDRFGLKIDVERVSEIAKKILDNRNIPHFHDEIVVDDGINKWEFKR